MARERRKQRKGNSLLARRSDQLEPMLELCGLLEHFRRLHRDLRHQFFLSRVPKPKVIIAPSMEHVHGIRGVQSECVRAIEKTTLRLAPLGHAITVDQFFSGIVSILWNYHLLYTRGAWHRSVPGWEEWATLYRNMPENMMAGLKALDKAVMAIIWSYSSCNATLFGYKMQFLQDSCAQVIVLEAMKCAEASVSIDGKTRKVFRVGGSLPDEGLVWAHASTEELGLAGPPTHVPVYIQAHALRTLRERIPIGNSDGERQDALFTSILGARVNKREGDTIWLEYLFRGQKLGYLLLDCSIIPLVVRTFLFLTMDGTPENEELKRRLRLGRRDKEYLGLDKLETFTHTDIGVDPLLRQLLNECGVGHLLDLNMENVSRLQYFEGQAALFRKHMCIPPSLDMNA